MKIFKGFQLYAESLLYFVPEKPLESKPAKYYIALCTIFFEVNHGTNDAGCTLYRWADRR